jgi:hypothetical protein
MSDAIERHPITLKRIVYHVEGMERVPVSRDIAYASTDEGPLTLDVYYPSAMPAGRGVPAVVLIAGYRDAGARSVLGCSFKEMEVVVSLAQLIAMSGMAAIAYTNRDPEPDARRVLDHLDRNADGLKIDRSRVGLWATSGNVPVALGVLMAQDRPALGAAVLSNGFMLEVNGSPVANAARTYGFVNATEGRSVEDLPSDLPIFVVRSGRDEFGGLNESLDFFVREAVRRNLPLTFVNHAAAPHGFELNHDSDTSRHILGQMLGFLRFHLGA